MTRACSPKINKNSKNFMPGQVYWGLKTKCSKFKPQELLEYLQKRVALDGWAKVVSHIRIEKGARNGEYYFFLGIISTDILTRQALQIWLSKLSNGIKIPKEFAHKDFPWDGSNGIRYMVGTAYELVGAAQPIPYISISQPRRSNPLILEVSIPESIPPDRSEKCEKLLWWLSASGSGSWETFQAVCDGLGIPQPRRLLRRLQLLGHLTVAQDGKRWQMQPPSLQPVGENRYVVYGQRNAALREALQQFGRLEQVPQPRRDAPACWQFEPQTDVATAIAKLQVSYPALAIRPFEAPPLWADWVAALSVIDWVPLHRYRLQRFDGCAFADLPIFAKETGFYKLHEQGSQGQHALFYDSERNAWYGGEWYGLRFLALARLSPEELSVNYNPSSQELSIPFVQRWPLAYECYLVVQSGCLPTYNPDTEELIYRNITPTVRQAIGARLPPFGLGE